MWFFSITSNNNHVLTKPCSSNFNIIQVLLYHFLSITSNISLKVIKHSSLSICLSQVIPTHNTVTAKHIQLTHKAKLNASIIKTLTQETSNFPCQCAKLTFGTARMAINGRCVCLLGPDKKRDPCSAANKSSTEFLRPPKQYWSLIKIIRDEKWNDFGGIVNLRKWIDKERVLDGGWAMQGCHWRRSIACESSGSLKQDDLIFWAVLGLPIRYVRGFTQPHFLPSAPHPFFFFFFDFYV